MPEDRPSFADSALPASGRTLAGLAAGNGWRSAAALAVAAAGVQAVFLLETARSLVFRYPLVDAATYHYQARALLDGQSASGAFWQTPGYPYFLAALEGLCGGAPLAARALQALVLAPLLSVLTWRLGLRLLPPSWAWAAGLATSVTGPLLFYASQLLPAAPAAVLFTAVLLLALRAAERPSVPRWFAAGAAAGLAAVMVATCAALAPVLAWAAWRSPGTLRARVLRVAALAAGLLLLVLPVAFRNAAQAGRWVGLATNGGVNLYIGNNRNWPVTLTAQPGLDWDALVRLPFSQGAARSDVDASRWFREKAFREMAGAPLDAVGRLALKALVFWHGREIPRNLDVYGWRRESLLLSAAVWRLGVNFPCGLLIPLAAAGALALRRRREGLLVAGALAAFGLLVALFFPCSRYRIPVLPAVVLLAAAGLHAWRAALRAGQRRAAAGLALTALLAGAAANAPLRWPTDRVRYDAHLQNAVGAAADVRGDLAQARACYETAVRLDPGLADAHFNLGAACERRGEQERAEACYRAALAARPDHDKAQLNLALLLTRRGLFAEALEHVARAEAANPLDANIWYNHAAILLRAGRRRDALAPLRQAAELDARHRVPYQQLLSEVR